MSDLKEEYSELVDNLKKDRDEIKLQLHLLSMDAKDEWHELENKFDHFMAKMDKAGDVAGDSMEEVKAGLGILSEELKSGYQKIKNIMKAN